ncbi:MAG: heavy metal-binding domain-containing protein [Actinomycetota bacterium]|nr:heavy metal-binding domain-containing protein [Actinomycetota bacterium]
MPPASGAQGRGLGFFHRDEHEDDERAQARARVADGHIPPQARARLRALASDSSLFTSGLSVSEFALLDRMGPQPLAQVMGASVVRPGWQYLPALDPGLAVTQTWSSPYTAGSWQPWRGPYTEASPAQVRNYVWHAEVICELDVLTAAWNLARRRALDRLTEEALELGADAVVGVRLHRSDHDLGAGTIEFVVTGTAIRLPGGTGTERPRLTDLSVQDYWRLQVAGREPVGLVATTTVVFAAPARTTRIARAWRIAANLELDELSTAFRSARETVRARIESQVRDAHGAGAVGVSLEHSVRRDKLALALSLGSASQRGWQRGRAGVPYFVSGHADTERRGWVITMHAAGTAVRPRSGAPARATATRVALRMGAR